MDMWEHVVANSKLTEGAGDFWEHLSNPANLGRLVPYTELQLNVIKKNITLNVSNPEIFLSINKPILNINLQKGIIAIKFSSTTRNVIVL